MEIEERLKRLEELVNMSRRKYKEGVAKADELLAKVQKNKKKQTRNRVIMNNRNKKSTGIIDYCCIHKFDLKAAFSALIISFLVGASILPFTVTEAPVTAGDGRRTESNNSK